MILLNAIKPACSAQELLHIFWPDIAFEAFTKMLPKVAPYENRTAGDFLWHTTNRRPSSRQLFGSSEAMGQDTE